MVFKERYLQLILSISLISILLIGFFMWRSSLKINSSEEQEAETSPPSISHLPEVPLSGGSQILTAISPEDAAIQQQLDRDREEQRQTKYLKTKLEQTSLELEQEKAVAEINKLKMSDAGALKEPSEGNQKDLPEIKVEYIGGDSTMKEAILSIAGTSFQVKEKSSPTDNIQVVSISDSSVTLHFNAPLALTKTIDYKPE